MRYTSSFVERLASDSSSPLLYVKGASVTGDQILKQAMAIAAMLEEHGLKNGDVAIAVVEAGPAFLAIVYATMGMHAIRFESPAQLCAALAERGITVLV